MAWLFYRLFGPVVRWWTRRHAKWSGFPCPWCGYGDFETMKPPYFFTARHGVQPGTPEGSAAYWCEGIQACPRCGCEWWLYDSN